MIEKLQWVNVETIIVLILLLGGVYLFQGYITQDPFRIIIGVIHVLLAGSIWIADKNYRL